MNHRWLEDFISLTETRNFTRSSVLRHSNQSAFSRRIKSLEEWLGADLFDRSTQPLALTQSGEAFKPIAEEILRKIELARKTVQANAEQADRSVSFAAPHSVASSFMPRWLRHLDSIAPDIEAAFYSHRMTRCFEMLDLGKVDFILSHTHPASRMLSDMKWKSVSLGHDLLIPVSAIDNEGGPLFGPEGSASQPMNYLAYGERSSIGRAIAQNMAEESKDIAPHTVFTSEFASILKSMTLERYGFAWLPYRDIHMELDSGLLVPAAPPDLNVRVEIRAFRLHEPLSTLAEHLWTLMSDSDETRSSAVRP